MTKNPPKTPARLLAEDLMEGRVEENHLDERIEQLRTSGRSRVQAIIWLARSLTSLERHDLVLEILGRDKEAQADDYGRIFTAVSLRNTGKTQEAWDTMAAPPHDEEVESTFVSVRASILALENRLEEAILLLEGIPKSNWDAGMYQQLAHLLLGLGRGEEALALLDTCPSDAVRPLRRILGLTPPPNPSRLSVFLQLPPAEREATECRKHVMRACAKKDLQTIVQITGGMEGEERIILLKDAFKSLFNQKEYALAWGILDSVPRAEWGEEWYKLAFNVMNADRAGTDEWRLNLILGMLRQTENQEMRRRAFKMMGNLPNEVRWELFREKVPMEYWPRRWLELEAELAGNAGDIATIHRLVEAAQGPFQDRLRTVAMSHLNRAGHCQGTLMLVEGIDLTMVDPVFLCCVTKALVILLRHPEALALYEAYPDANKDDFCRQMEAWTRESIRQHNERIARDASRD